MNTVSNFPWQLSVRPKRAPNNNRSSIVARCGLSFGHAELDLFEDAILSTLPPVPYWPFKWYLEPSKPPYQNFAYLGVPALDDSVQTMIGFGLKNGTHPVLAAAYLEFSKTWQNKGFATALARNLLLVADTLKLERIDALANIDIGSYAWASMGARPDHAGQEKKTLDDRIAELLHEGKWTLSQARKARRLLNSSDPDFMFVLSQLRGGPRKLGYELMSDELIGRYAWHAHWDLTDPVHRKIIASRLYNVYN